MRGLFNASIIPQKVLIENMIHLFFLAAKFCNKLLINSLNRGEAELVYDYLSITSRKKCNDKSFSILKQFYKWSHLIKCCQAYILSKVKYNSVNLQGI